MTHTQKDLTQAGVLALVLACLFGCAALSSVTPADRAQAYAAEARGVATLCKAYRFDRSVGLVADVPAMTELCGPVRP